jgi:phosphorylase kinase alpha/beta subunit
MDLTKIETLLDKHFHSINKIILSRQDPITGLLPASTAINAHGDYTDAWVRDNVYSILSVWGLCLSYTKYYPNSSRTYILNQSVVKLMRGLLTSMMRQSHKVEVFKHTLNPVDALHAKYGTNTGLAVVGDHEWGHLQLDATSLYLLMIVQMTASGLKIVYTIDEVNFIQNIVHYISRTYCTPDYGIWERGNKINHGTPEINCSSVGMAKAALEAIDKFNLFGDIKSQEAIIHVISNDIARSRFTLQGLLPRESNSKETDASLLSIIGYPAYAVEDKKLVELTRNKILDKLGGEYGCKRFLLDGHQSSMEDSSKLHYEPFELKEFEHIESQWPLFFTYLLLDALIREDSNAIEKWQKKLQPLFVEQNGEKLLPELYIVPKESVEGEKEKPNSQKRVPNENIPLVWAQSLYMLSDMILDGILQPNDIDPLKRRERIGHTKTVKPSVLIIAEDKKIQQELLNSGIQSETLDDLTPIRVMYSDELSRVHTVLGKNDKLGLTGRPFLEIRTITTSSLYQLVEDEIIFLPYYFNPKGFYFSYDNQLLVEHFKSSLKVLTNYWDQPKEPIISFFVRADMLIEKDKALIIELLTNLQKGRCEEVVLRQGSLDKLKDTIAVEKINYLHNIKLYDLSSQSRSFQHSNPNKETGYTLNLEKLNKLENLDTEQLLNIVVENKNRLKSAIVLKILFDRVGKDYKTHISSLELTLLELAQIHYKYATTFRDWVVVRRLADLTKKHDDRLEDALLDIVIRQKQLSVSKAFHKQAIFFQPVDSIGIIKRIDEFCGSNTAESVLTQEIILHLGHLIRTEPALFKNILTLRTWYYVQLMVGQISYEKGLSIGEAYELLLSLSPYELFVSLRSILNSYTKKVELLNAQETMNASGIYDLSTLKSNLEIVEDPKIHDWLQWRVEIGLIGHMSSKFHKYVWYILQQCHGIIIGDKYDIHSKIGSELTLESTPNERRFEVLVDTQLQRIAAPEYRQLNIEMIESLARLFGQNHNIHIEGDIVLDVLIGHAVRISWCKHNDCENYNEQKSKAWENIYKLSPKEVDAVFIQAFKHLLIPQKQEEIHLQ